VVHTVAVIPRRRAAAVALALLLGTSTAACAHDGRTLAPTRPDQTTTTKAVGTGPTGAPSVFTLSSAAVVDGAELPQRYTCTGEGISPTMQWTFAPPAEELALVVRDRDAGGFVHWIVTGIDPTSQSFGDGGLPETATEQANSTGALGYLPPCPPAGSGRHVYQFVLHALSAPLTIDPALPAADAAARVEAASIGSAELSVSVDGGE
jgi:Raf kinase inhibitor-like YbhB/YbcL family protein